MFTRAGSLLGANWSLHDLRHTAAYQFQGQKRAADRRAVDFGACAAHDHADLYHHANMQQKQEAIEKTAPPGSKQAAYKPPDPLLRFLENL